MKGTLYLVPNTLGNPDTSLCIPIAVQKTVLEIEVFIVENLRNARRYLKRLDRSVDIDSLTFYELNEHSDRNDFPSFLEPALRGKHIALLSEAGVPGVADPGSDIVRLAHTNGIRVVPLTGPSSILLSLMASGLNGQSFCFHGYLPVKRPERIRKIREIEQLVLRKNETQLFIEAPYRNDAILTDILENCQPSTLLCIAADITLDTEHISTRKVADWSKQKPTLHKRPVIFLLGK